LTISGSDRTKKQAVLKNDKLSGRKGKAEKEDYND
jgi:hypothetical protein